MKLLNILENLNYIIYENKEIADIEINNVNIEVNNIRENDLYILKNSKIIKEKDEYILETQNKKILNDNIEKAIENKAKAIVIEEKLNIDINKLSKKIIVILVQNIQIAECIIAANYFKNPSTKLKVVGITGSTGKEETIYALRQILVEAKKNVAILTKKNAYLNDKKINNNWMRSNFDLQENLYEMLSENIEYVIVECDSILLKHNIFLGIIFEIAGFTNISNKEKYLKTHENLTDYLHSKLKLIEQAEYLVLNNDDFASPYLKNKKVDKDKILTYGIMNKSDVQITNINVKISKTNYMSIIGRIVEKIEINMPGKNEVMYTACSLTIALKLNIEFEYIKLGLFNAYVPGKFEHIKTENNYPIIIDNPVTDNDYDELFFKIQTMSTGRTVALISMEGLDIYDDPNLNLEDEKNIQLIKNEEKRRNEIGKRLSKLCDFIVVTVSKPKFEPEDNIMEQIIKGIDKTKAKYFKYYHRKDGLKKVLQRPEIRDMIIILGLGDERFLKFKDRMVAFKEREEILKILKTNSTEEKEDINQIKENIKRILENKGE